MQTVMYRNLQSWELQPLHLRRTVELSCRFKVALHQTVLGVSSKDIMCMLQHPWQGPKWELVAACFSLKGGRADFLVEKAAELGAYSLRPILTVRSPYLGEGSIALPRMPQLRLYCLLGANCQALGSLHSTRPPPTLLVYTHGIVTVGPRTSWRLCALRERHACARDAVKMQSGGSSSTIGTSDS